jgi:hypothetical protein
MPAFAATRASTNRRSLRVHGWYRKGDWSGAQVEWLLIPAAGHPLHGVRDTAVHLVIGQDDVEHVEIVGDALRV